MDRHHAVKAEVDPCFRISKEHYDLRVLLDIFEMLAPGTLPVGEGFVIKDHHTAFVANIGLAILGGRGQNARTPVSQGVINHLAHLIC